MIFELGFSNWSIFPVSPSTRIFVHSVYDSELTTTGIWNSRAKMARWESIPHFSLTIPSILSKYSARSGERICVKRIFGHSMEWTIAPSTSTPVAIPDESPWFSSAFSSRETYDVSVFGRVRFLYFSYAFILSALSLFSSLCRCSSSVEKYIWSPESPHFSFSSEARSIDLFLSIRIRAYSRYRAKEIALERLIP